MTTKISIESIVKFYGVSTEVVKAQLNQGFSDRSISRNLTHEERVQKILKNVQSELHYYTKTY